MSEKTFDERFIELLKAHNDFVDDNTGELLRERIKRRAYDLDKDLITLLLSDDTVAAAYSLRKSQDAGFSTIINSLPISRIQTSSTSRIRNSKTRSD